MYSFISEGREYNFLRLMPQGGRVLCGCFGLVGCYFNLAIVMRQLRQEKAIKDNKGFQKKIFQHSTESSGNSNF